MTVGVVVVVVAVIEPESGERGGALGNRRSVAIWSIEGVGEWCPRRSMGTKKRKGGRLANDLRIGGLRGQSGDQPGWRRPTMSQNTFDEKNACIGHDALLSFGARVRNRDAARYPARREKPPCADRARSPPGVSLFSLGGVAQCGVRVPTDAAAHNSGQRPLSSARYKALRPSLGSRSGPISRQRVSLASLSCCHRQFGSCCFLYRVDRWCFPVHYQLRTLLQ